MWGYEMRKDKIVEVIRQFAYGVEIKPVGVGIVQHPFFNSIMGFDLETKEMFVMDTPEKKEKALRQHMEVIEKGETFGAMMYHVNKPWRIDILWHCQHYLTLEEFSEALGIFWTELEYPNAYSIHRLIKMFKMAEKQKLMDDNEMKVLESLPETVTIYRGLQGKNAKVRGLSWTVKKEVAVWFAKRFAKKNKVYTAVVPKKHIFMYCEGRNEEEVVVNPYHLKDIAEVEVA